MELLKNINVNFYNIKPEDVHSILNKYMLVDGFDFVLDLNKSKGSYLIDARTGKKYIDFFSFFASVPLGLNHPEFLKEETINYLGKIAINKPSNSDVYTTEMASFVKTLFEIAVPNYFKYVFFISGGALAVENALKTAFDWKIRQNFRKGYQSEKGTKIIHFKEAFHGRSGYTMSLTNTDPNKVKFFPKFDWPRIINPKLKFPLTSENIENTIKTEEIAISQIKQVLIDNKDDIAAIIIEPIQGEGGDNHFRSEFLKKLREIADENNILLIFDEIQTGVGITGTWWAHQQLDVKPDLMCFGKKMQVCGILVTDRIDTEPENVFKVSSRINSTWGGSLIDMVRSRIYLEIIESEKILENVRELGLFLNNKLNEVVLKYPEILENPRNKGLFGAIDFKEKAKRKEFLKKCFDNGLFILPCGEKSIRFRPVLDIKKEVLEEGFYIFENCLIN